MGVAIGGRIRETNQQCIARVEEWTRMFNNSGMHNSTNTALGFLPKAGKTSSLCSSFMNGINENINEQALNGINQPSGLGISYLKSRDPGVS